MLKKIYKSAGTLVVMATLGAIASNSASAENLWAGEEIIEARGYPAITKFIKGDSSEPLIVFIPGAHHSARISYGGHTGSEEDNFLSYWLNKKGYNFLGISYPIETKSGAMDNAYPNFTIRDWGAQAAEISLRTIKENNLKNQVIILGWSMAGKIVQAYSEAANEIELKIDFYTSLAATPPLPGIITMNKSVNMTSTGLADRSQDIPKWFKQIDANTLANGGDAIIPWEIYETEYTGNISIQQQGYGLRYREGQNQFVRDHWEDIQDAKGYEYGSMPLVAMITPSSEADIRHTLTDTSTWSLYNANKILSLYKEVNKSNTISETDVASLKDITQKSSTTLAREVKGNHFFFVGRHGAKETADAISELDERVEKFKTELAVILGGNDVTQAKN
ncbi:hypothetical protein GCM10011348_21760 [Marinobacterium nitratireducens]|uniref:AB hydrolase-1 domain-containing protein n=1 Tax=Marinobacterium nitratireducens TaxID=518897 RepID=A0A918DS58_9GAMM|nr:thioesterase domain-containing protein [Marinobacterium nitratireducens]GGO81837.1 hypothetical protein GCM10011348_21760 [Marinobacterium nitratireducens]